MRALVADCAMRRSLAQLALHGLETIRERHSCGQRVDELLAVVDVLRGAPKAAA